MPVKYRVTTQLDRLPDVPPYPGGVRRSGRQEVAAFLSRQPRFVHNSWVTSSQQIPGPPSVLFFNFSGDATGWETDLAKRVSVALGAQGVPASGPFAVASSEQAASLVEQHAQANCWLLFTAGHGESGVAGVSLEAAGAWLARTRQAPRIAAVYPCQHPGEARRGSVVGPGGFAVMAVVAKPEMSPREAALFFPELFGELRTHCQKNIAPAMVRFCFAKANRLAPSKAEMWTA